jgi:hypothetical protein
MFGKTAPKPKTVERAMRSLRRLSSATFLGSTILLALLIITGYSQNRLMGDYSAIVKASESTIFLYSTIREQTTVGLLSKKPAQILSAAREIEQLQGRYTDMLENRLIPSQYKISFLKEIDLEQIVIELKMVAENLNDMELTLKIQSQFRKINTQFLQFDRIVIAEMKNRVMHFQKQALILMGLITSITSFTLIILYKKSVKPLISLAQQCRDCINDHAPLELDNIHGSSIEVRTLIDSFNHLLEQRQDHPASSPLSKQMEVELSTLVNEVTNRLNGIINYAQLLADSCQEGEEDKEQKEILNKIITNGEKSAVILQQSLHRGET